MAAGTHRLLLRSSLSSKSPQIKPQTLRFMTTISPSPSHHRHLEQEYSKPCNFLGSWDPPQSKDPREAQEKLAMLRREYAKQVKELRKEYFYEMELQREEKRKKDEAKKEAIRVAKEERKAAKAALSQAKAAERKLVDEEFRQTLLKERAEKLEYWRTREKRVEEKKKEKTELLRKQSSLWVDDKELGKKLLEAMVDSFRL